MNGSKLNFATIEDLVGALGAPRLRRGEKPDPEIAALVEALAESHEAANDPVGEGDGDPVGTSETPASPEGPEGPGDPGDPEDPEVRVPGADAPPGVTLTAELPIDADDDLRGVEGEASARLVSIIESLLFAATKPLTVKRLRRVLHEPTKKQIQLALKQLQESMKDRGIVLRQVAGGFQLGTNPNNARWVQKLLQAKPARLSRSQLETLAIVAYRQPVTRAEIDSVRGVDSGAVLRLLLEKDMIQIVGRKEEPGRPLLYGTTVRFLEFFNLQSLRDMPSLRDLQELSEESQATVRDRFGENAPEESEAEALGQEVIEFPEGEIGAAGDGDTPTGDEQEAAGQGDAGALLEDPGADADEDTEASPDDAEVSAEDGPDAEVDADEGDDAEIDADEGDDAVDADEGDDADPEADADDGEDPEADADDGDDAGEEMDAVDEDEGDAGDNPDLEEEGPS